MNSHAIAEPPIQFRIPGNKNNNRIMVAWNPEPYNFSTYNTLTINYAIDPQMVYFASLGINVAGATPSATLASEVCTALNANATFANLFQATTQPWQAYLPRTRDPINTVLITCIKPAEIIRTYITNAGAEQLMRFNKNAGIAELPTYFSRYALVINGVANPTFNPLNANLIPGYLVQLNGADTVVDLPIIRNFLNNQAWTNSNLQTDWQLLSGRDRRLLFTNSVVNTSGNISGFTSTITWPAGAGIGDMGVQQLTNSSGTQTYQIPYVLQSGDIAGIASGLYVPTL